MSAWPEEEWGTLSPPCQPPVKQAGQWHYGVQDKGYHFLSYDPATWAGLEQIQSGIEALRDKLTAVLGTEDGRAQLTAHGAAVLGLLPAPAPGLEDVAAGEGLDGARPGV